MFICCLYILISDCVWIKVILLLLFYGVDCKLFDFGYELEYGKVKV